MTYLPKIVELKQQVGKSSFEGTLLSVDPGETTGVSVLKVSPDEVVILDQNQIKSWPLELFVNGITPLILFYNPNTIIYEAYHVYSWRLNEHKFSEVPTIQIIGSLKTLCVQYKIPFVRQTAQTGKAFFTDERLKTFEAFFEGKQHARDSLRHALQFVVFSHKEEREREGESLDVYT